MAEWETIQDRTISGKGVLKVPNDDKKVRAYVLYADVIRKPSQEYLNFQWNPKRGRYGNLVFIREGYAVGTATIDFMAQAFDGINDISGQTLLAVKCAYDGILESFVNLGVALGLTPVAVTDLIKDYENLRNSWDEVRLQCYADTAVQLRLESLRYDVCDEEKNKDKPPRKPPPPKPLAPPGTAVPNDPPYDEDTSDDDNSNPFPGDEPLPPPPVGDTCVQYDVFYTFVITRLSTGVETVFTRIARVWGEIGSISFNLTTGGGSQILIECRGLVRLKNAADGGTLLEPNQPCGDFRNVTTDELSLSSAEFPITDAIITSIEEV